MSHAPRCIAFVSPLGGTGQTSIAANLASLWHTDQTPCLAVDLCAQNTLGLHLGLQQAADAGWAAQAAAGQWWAEAALENSHGVRFLPYGQPGKRTDNNTLQAALAKLLHLQPLWLATQLESVALDDGSLVLLDAPTWPHSLAQQALGCADLVVVCLDCTPRALHMAPQVQALLQQARQGTALALLATGFNPRRDSQRQALQDLQQHWGEALSPYVLHDDENMATALAAHQCVTRFAPQAQSAHDLQGLARWLLTRCPAWAADAPGVRA